MREWYNSDNTSLKEIALQAFNEKELICNFKNITTFQKACEVLGLNYGEMLSITNHITPVSKASAAMFKLNIIRKALNLGQDLHLTENPKDSCICYPYNPFVTKDSTYYKRNVDSGKMEVIGKIKNEGTLYYVLCGHTYNGYNAGLGSFSFSHAYAYADVGFLGCANREIAEHFSKYFGMLITEAKYTDIVDFEIISNY